MSITILNSSILTSFGSFSYQEIDLDRARQEVQNGFKSAIGHVATAEIISRLLGINCPVHRVMYKQEEGQKALVFKLNSRVPEGDILTIPEIEKIGYHFGLLTKLGSGNNVLDLSPELVDSITRVSAYLRSTANSLELLPQDLCGFMLDQSRRLKSLSECAAPLYCQNVYLDYIYPLYVYKAYTVSDKTFSDFAKTIAVFESTAQSLITRGAQIQICLNGISHA